MTVSPFHPMQLALGLIVWSVYFVVVYGGLSVGCKLSPPPMEQGTFNWLNGTLLLVTLITGAWLLYQAWHCWRAPAHVAHNPDDSEIVEREPGSDQLRQARLIIVYVATGVNLVAGLATLAVGVPLLVLVPCA